jgi:acetylornithine deacetylase/succinyl-diaminopimelate desuccinylase-like protein
VSELVEWLRIPSISGDPDHVDDVRRSADWLADALRGLGFPTVEIWETPGLPAVFASGRRMSPPPRPSSCTAITTCSRSSRSPCGSSPPFEPTVADGVLRGRGAADDKGQVWFHSLGLRAHLAATGRTAPAVNVKVLVEGEEESGVTPLRRPAAPAALPARLRRGRRVRHERLVARAAHVLHRHARHGVLPGRPARALG